jgi:hypothetical protein
MTLLNFKLSIRVLWISRFAFTPLLDNEEDGDADDDDVEEQETEIFGI